VTQAAVRRLCEYCRAATQAYNSYLSNHASPPGTDGASPRFISCLGPLIAGTLIGYFGGYGPAATFIGLFFILGIVAAPFLPETNGKPLPERTMPGRPALTS
jgi:hypothetical protein